MSSAGCGIPIKCMLLHRGSRSRLCLRRMEALLRELEIAGTAGARVRRVESILVLEVLGIARGSSCHNENI